MMQIINDDLYDISMRYGYIYKTNLPDGRFYIGQKKSKVVVENYWGSGKHLINWFKKNVGASSQNCPKILGENASVTQDILAWAIDQEELNVLEQHFIAYYKDIDICNECLNIHPGGTGSYFKHKGKFYLTEESIKKANQTKKERGALGLYKLSEEQLKARGETISQVIKQKGGPWNKGLTKETDPRVAKQAISRKNTPYTPELRQIRSKAFKNKFWWNNGKHQVRSETSPGPEYTQGMLKRGNK